MKMKLSYVLIKASIIYVLIIFDFFSRTNSTKSKTEFNLKNHFAMMMQFKAQTKSLLNNLFDTANTHTMESESANENTNTNNNESSRTKFKVGKTLRKTILKSKSLTHSSKLRNAKAAEYTQYRYKRFHEIVELLNKLSQEFPDYLKFDTAQKMYGLPNPGGYCGPNKQKCEHYVAFLTNHKVDNKYKHQIFFSGEVHGDEHIGPTAMIEMIELMLRNKDNPWFSHLLDTRYIVIVPMTNPHGYYEKIREELLIEDEDAAVLTSKNYEKTHKDINRDFPYLVKKKNCMETIGARVVNELYINHLFSLALSLHGGTESLTYPYGTPNHMIGSGTPKIPMSYLIQNGKASVDSSKVSDQAKGIVKQYRAGVFDMINGKSSESPDNNALKEIAETASIHTTSNPKFKYQTGDMTGTVYPVTGGMEDWAYSGSWEGFPVITQPCTPKTYGGYNSEKTLYDKNYKDALKSIMFLLEVSHEKIPEQKLLGRKNVDCLINIRQNAFFNKIAPNKNKCLDGLIDGYVPRIIRLSLLLIDILQPYINYRHTKKENNLHVQWAVGGAIKVEETFILYDFFNETPDNNFIKSIYGEKDPKITQSKLLKKMTQSQKGKAIWEKDYSKKDFFNFTFEEPSKSGKYIVFAIYAKVDQDWGKQVRPDPQVPPQTHISNIRINDQYTAKNNNFEIRGQLYYKSKVAILDTQQLKRVMRRLK